MNHFAGPMRKSCRWLIIVVFALAVGGCLSTQNRSASGLTAEQQSLQDALISQGMQKEKATLIAVSPVAQQLYFDDQKCRGYGAKHGSDAYVACRAQLEAGHTKPPAVVVQSPSQPTHCSSMALGGGLVSTNCN